MTHPLFPYVLGALFAFVFGGLAFAVSELLAFRDEVRAGLAGAEARAIAAAALAQRAIDENARQDVALERQAGELMQHRLSAPPPRLFDPAPNSGVLLARGHVQTSEDWDDGEGRATQARPSQPPPLPAYGRPGYMSR